MKIFYSPNGIKMQWIQILDRAFLYSFRCRMTPTIKSRYSLEHSRFTCRPIGKGLLQ